MTNHLWKTMTLGDCVTLLSGGTPSKRNPNYWGGTIPWVSSKELKHERIYTTDDLLTPEGAANGTRVVPRGTILIVVRSMILANRFPVSIAMRDVAINQDLKAVVCEPHVTPGFIFNWLRANTHEILGRVDEAGHGTKRLQTERLLSIPIDVPPLEDQRRVGSILAAYDDLVENLEKRIQLLEAMKREVYREWCSSETPADRKQTLLRLSAMSQDLGSQG